VTEQSGSGTEGGGARSSNSTKKKVTITRFSEVSKGDGSGDERSGLGCNKLLRRKKTGDQEPGPGEQSKKKPETCKTNQGEQ